MEWKKIFWYDKEAQLAAEKLDNYDLMDILKYCYQIRWLNPWDIKGQIHLKYDELDEFLDDLSIDEFMLYLESKYPVKFEEFVDYRMWMPKE